MNSCDGDWGLGIGDWGLGIGLTIEKLGRGFIPFLDLHGESVLPVLKAGRVFAGGLFLPSSLSLPGCHYPLRLPGNNKTFP